MKNHNNNLRKKGMTLIELVIVLGILAAIASYALSSMDTLTDRTRYDTTVRTMNQLQTAIVGKNAEVSRFVNDMGRLPIVRSKKTGEEFRELISTDGMPDDDKKNWKGPYLLTGKSKFFDGFGNQFEIQTIDKDEVFRDWHKADDSSVKNEETIVGIRSVGKDGVGNESPTAGTSWADKDYELKGFEGQTSATLTVVVKTLSKISSPDNPKWILPTFAEKASDNDNVYKEENWHEATLNDFLIRNYNNEIKLYRCIYRNSAVQYQNKEDLKLEEIEKSGNLEGKKNNIVLMKWKYIDDKFPTEILSSLECKIENRHVFLPPQNTNQDFTGIFDFDKTKKLYAGDYEIKIEGKLNILDKPFKVNTVKKPVKLRPGNNIITIYLTEPLIKQ